MLDGKAVGASVYKTPEAYIHGAVQQAHQTVDDLSRASMLAAPGLSDRLADVSRHLADALEVNGL